ncbi:toll/interleukin-1 receptor domain-containing protein [Cognatazoarcus halotolerans]|uniref:toll/interleukin-1 receptor domain-containing protein n=1 Tax=Cognatazoarcus halotolerans TaxID=2686016 RepID=UPI00135AEA7E|nr:toll/interleukin-1 receptor domain-containing protein [Cognatazoarcus halotolerans]MCB1899094.1 toll/interleukin-1 receptor domain-containing protein [Rhodocyclaceae bacterium]MCP5307728.1 toll/interleukin-1 receptor domain-containing protein [Zoogloeaceae bacterium]
MQTVFLSYATEDYFFAELAEIKLENAGIRIWRDQDRLRAGSDWRHGIEAGIDDCVAVLVALSPRSAQSPYVTFEWAYALGKGKPVIPLKLAECTFHPRLEPIQYLDFSHGGHLPWESLVERIREIETETPDPDAPVESPRVAAAASAPADPQTDADIDAVLAYLEQRGFRMASFERLQNVLDRPLDDAAFEKIIAQSGGRLRSARLKGDKAGLARTTF